MSQPFCHHCGLNHQCICTAIPKLSTALNLSLLMHEKESTRETNTGRWLVDAIPACHAYLWHRQQPEEPFQQQLDNPALMQLLLFPSASSQSLEQGLQLATQRQKTPHFIILDGTWQEAKKMERKSTWLASIPRVQLIPLNRSAYRLRKNQQQGELCTLEIVAELLEQLQETDNAEALRHFLHQFMAVFQADKSGHIFQRP